MSFISIIIIINVYSTEFILGLVLGGMIIMMWRIGVWIHRSTFHPELMCRLSDVCRYLFSPENHNQEIWRPEQVIVDNSSPPLNYDDMDSAPFVWVLTSENHAQLVVTFSV